MRKRKYRSRHEDQEAHEGLHNNYSELRALRVLRGKHDFAFFFRDSKTYSNSFGSKNGTHALSLSLSLSLSAPLMILVKHERLVWIASAEFGVENSLTGAIRRQ
jgi:hypothetical protein